MARATNVVCAVVPTRNRPELLRRALDAIVRQTYAALEVIVVDDGSNAQNSEENARLTRQLGPRARYLRLATPAGPGAARNAGVREATGEFIAFCDDDDYWCDDGHIVAAVEAFRQDPLLDLVFANQHAHAEGKLSRVVWLPRLLERLRLEPKTSYPPRRLAPSEYPTDDFGHMNTCVFRRELLLKIGGFWEAARYLEDMDLFVRAVDAARHVAYRHHTVAVHNVPDRSVAANASTVFDEAGRHLAAIAVADHLVAQCRSTYARRFAAEAAGYAYRHLASRAAKSGQDGAAFRFARLGLARLPTLKWTAYTALLGVRAIVAPLWRARQPEAGA